MIARYGSTLNSYHTAGADTVSALYTQSGYYADRFADHICPGILLPSYDAASRDPGTGTAVS